MQGGYLDVQGPTLAGYYKVYDAVAAMWVFNMLFSTLWLNAF